MKRISKSLAVVVTGLSLLTVPVVAENSHHRQEEAAKAQITLPQNPRDLVRAAIENQLKNTTRQQLSTWREKDVKPKVTTVKQMVETPEGVLGRIIEKDGHKLTPEEEQGEDARVNRLLDPDQMKDKAKEQKADEERTIKMLRAIPDAFLFTYGENTTAPNGDKLAHITFKPNPDFNPPSRECLVFQGMQGSMIVDVNQQQLAKIDGTLFRDVNIGWGIIGRLNSGGRFVVEQAEVYKGHWDQTHMILNFQGKALLFKTIKIEEDSTAWGFQPVEKMDVKTALAFLKSKENAASDTTEAAK